MLMAGYIRHTEVFEIIDGCSQSHSIGNIACPGFKPSRGWLIRGLLKGHVDDHVAAPLPGRGFCEHFRLAVKHPNARGRKDLMAGEDIKVTIKRLHIDRHMGNCLRAIEENPGSVAMGHL